MMVILRVMMIMTVIINYDNGNEPLMINYHSFLDDKTNTNNTTIQNNGIEYP